MSQLQTYFHYFLCFLFCLCLGELDDTSQTHETISFTHSTDDANLLQEMFYTSYLDIPQPSQITHC